MLGKEVKKPYDVNLAGPEHQGEPGRGGARLMMGEEGNNILSQDSIDSLLTEVPAGEPIVAPGASTDGVTPRRRRPTCRRRPRRRVRGRGRSPRQHHPRHRLYRSHEPPRRWPRLPRLNRRWLPCSRGCGRWSRPLRSSSPLWHRPNLPGEATLASETCRLCRADS